MQLPPPSERGFSLVELSIVLVILGLLTGGILAGQSLIRAAELRSISTDYARFVAATQSFRDKYMALPGDMNNATRFWLRHSSDGWCTTNSSAAVGTPGTCDGDGDGVIESPAAASQSGDRFQFWRQLALAGMIEGSYTGLAGSGSAWHAIINTNVPRGKISNTGYTIAYYNSAGDANNFAMNYGNQITFGAQNGTVDTSGPVLRAEEMWNLDTKMDDGKPGTGDFISTFWDTCTLATSFSDLNAAYDLTQQNLCSIRYRNVF